MELDDYMTNRTLLEKMTDTDIHKSTFRKPPKNQQMLNNIPKELCVEYKNTNLCTVETNLDRQHSTKSSRDDCHRRQEKHDPEDTCRVSRRVKQTAKVVWTGLLMLYMLGMPVVLYHLYTRVEDSRHQLEILQNDMQLHYKKQLYRSDNINKAWTFSKGTDRDLANRILTKSYSRISGLETRTMEILLELQMTMEEHRSRLEHMERVSDWINKTKFDFSKLDGSKSCECVGLPGPPGRPGKNGVNGRPGSTGSPGFRGLRGITGLPGAGGPHGAPGSKGDCDCEFIYKGVPGPRGPPGAPCKHNDPERFDRGSPGKTGVRGGTGSTGQHGAMGDNATCSHCRSTLLHTSYTRWGRTTCDQASNATALYSGFVAGAHHNSDGGGTNYLCLPTTPSYGGQTREEKDYDYLSKLHRVQFEVGASKIFETPINIDQYYDLSCTVCDVTGRSHSLMWPATDRCPAGWSKDYQGYLMAPREVIKRGQYICVDTKPDVVASKRGDRTFQNGGLLHFVEYSGNLKSYKEDYALSCVVCSK